MRNQIKFTRENEKAVTKLKKLKVAKNTYI